MNTNIHSIHPLLDRFVAVVIVAMCATGVLAGNGYDLFWNTCDGGGATSIGGGYSLTGTIGQPDASVAGALQGGLYRMTGGFWGSDGPLPLPTCPPDIFPQPSGDDTVNMDDLLMVINAWGASGNNPADIDDNNTVNIDDLLIVITSWGPCP